MARYRGGESKQGLVVTLVFFILTTLGLGVATYYGFAEQNALRGKAKEADDKVKKAETVVVFYRNQVAVYRSYLGLTNDPNSPTMRGLNEERSKILQGAYDAEHKEDGPAAKTAYGDLESKVGPWDEQGQKASKNYPQLVQELTRQLDAARVALDNEKKARLQAEEDARRDARALAKAKEDFAEEIRQFKAREAKRDNDDRANFAKLIADSRINENDVKDPNDPKKRTFQTLARELIALEKERETLIKAQEELTLKVKALDDELKTLKARDENARRTGQIKEEERFRIHGNIVAVSRDGTRATISIGSARNLKPQTTFAVYSPKHVVGYDPSRPDTDLHRIVGPPKGSVEVVSVQDRTAEVVITLFHPNPEEIDRRTGRRRIIRFDDRDNTDPVLKGDLLVNPRWSDQPQPKRIAIAGVVDLTGDGTNDINYVRRVLEKQNIIVVAYIDPDDGKMRDQNGRIITEISKGTEEIIKAQRADENVAGGARQRAQEINKTADLMLLQADKIGVKFTDLKSFLETTGVPPPRRTQR